MSKYIKLDDAHDVVSSRTRLYDLKGTDWIDVGLDQLPTVELNDERKLYAIHYDRIDSGEKTFTPYVRFVCTRDIGNAVLRFVTSEIRPLKHIDTEILDYVSIDEAMCAFENEGWKVYMSSVMRFRGEGKEK